MPPHNQQPNRYQGNNPRKDFQPKPVAPGTPATPVVTEEPPLQEQQLSEPEIVYGSLKEEFRAVMANNLYEVLAGKTPQRTVIRKLSTWYQNHDGPKTQEVKNSINELAQHMRAQLDEVFMEIPSITL